MPCGVRVDKCSSRTHIYWQTIQNPLNWIRIWATSPSFISIESWKCNSIIHHTPYWSNETKKDTKLAIVFVYSVKFGDKIHLFFCSFCKDWVPCIVTYPVENYCEHHHWVGRQFPSNTRMNQTSSEWCYRNVIYDKVLLDVKRFKWLRGT